MNFLLFESEVIAKEVAWQLRTKRIGKLVVMVQTDPEAIRLAVLLAGGKIVKRWRLCDLLALSSILSLVFMNIPGRIDNPEELSCSYLLKIDQRCYLDREQIFVNLHRSRNLLDCSADF